MKELSSTLPELGIGDDRVLTEFNRVIADGSAPLSAPTSFAHMDPPPPEVATEVTRLNARANQNLLHPSLSPFATIAEDKVIEWLSPFFGMCAGHMCGGSTLANLTALWCAREHGATSVVASQEAHVSVRKAAAILGLPFHPASIDGDGRLDVSGMGELSDAALVLTAGSTGRGVVDPLADDSFHVAAWRHVDAAWAGPLRLTKFANRLDGIELADSVAISAHKWLFQPKASALILFADSSHQAAISYGESYLARPNVGVQGSRGAVGVTLLATLLAWGRVGLAQRIEGCMAAADDLAKRLTEDPRTELLNLPETGVLNWRPKGIEPERLLRDLENICSSVELSGQIWIRNVAANPSVNIDCVWKAIDHALSQA